MQQSLIRDRSISEVIFLSEKQEASLLKISELMHEEILYIPVKVFLPAKFIQKINYNDSNYYDKNHKVLCIRLLQLEVAYKQYAHKQHEEGHGDHTPYS